MIGKIGLLLLIFGMYLVVGWIEAQDADRRIPVTQEEIVAISEQR